MSAVRLSIRPAAYRGKPGFNVSGRDGYGRSIRIFARTRSGAEGIVRAIKAHAAGHITERERQREVDVRLSPGRRSRPRRRDVGGGSPRGMFAGRSYHSALTAARAEAKKCRTPWYVKEYGGAWYMTDTHPALPYVKVHVDERAVKHAMGDPRRRRRAHGRRR